MYRATLEAEGEVGYPLTPLVISLITDRSKAVLLILFSKFACYVSVSVLFSPSVSLGDIQL